MAKSTIYDILGTIRDNSSALYQERVPEATRENLVSVGQAITDDAHVMNEYLTALVKKVAKTIIANKRFNNPLKKLKGEGIPYGSTIEEIYINPIVDVGYDGDGTELLKSAKPDGKVCYYSLAKPRRYPVTVTKFQIIQSFTSESAWNNLFEKIIVALYSGDDIDEFLLMKQLVGNVIDAGKIDVVACDIEQPKELAKSISSMKGLFQFPSTKYCGYNKTVKEGETECITYCDTKEQVLLMTIEAQTEINFEYLASQFNMDLVDIKGMVVTVDSIPSEKFDVYAVLADKSAIRVHDVNYEITDFYNASTLEHKFYLHHLQYMHCSMFANCKAFGKAKEVVDEVQEVDEVIEG